MAAFTAPEFAFEEEVRAEGMTARIVTIMADPRNPSTGSLPLYRNCARRAFETWDPLESTCRHASLSIL